MPRRTADGRQTEDQERMSDRIDRLNSALADRYRLEREFGAGGMATGFPGTPHFMSPQQATGDASIGSRADLAAFAACDVGFDGRLLMLGYAGRLQADQPDRRLILGQNWLTELRERLGGDR
jgi:hypothetical protein